MLGNLYRGADLDTQLSFTCKNVSTRLASTSILQLRDKGVNDAVCILHSYRKYCAQNSSSGQLILPEALKLLPLYTLALNKSALLRSQVTADGRMYAAGIALSGTVARVGPMIYAR